MRQIGPCRLCLQQRKLADSHIIPEFFYRQVYGSDHRARLYRTNSTHAPVIQSGPTERLLCEQDCEGRLQRFESCFSRLWYGRRSVLPTRVREDQVLEISEDYAQFKLCLLSILWRAGITTHPMFSGVELGSRHEERLRRMVLDNNPEPSATIRS